MRYEQTKELTGAEFQRMTGVKRIVFVKMALVLLKARRKQHKKGGRSNKLSIADTLLMALQYWREYPTYFSLGIDYGITESYAWKQVKWVEDTLIKSGEYSLAGKKALLENNAYDIVLIDATETPVERPKRGRKSGIPARKSATQ